MHMDNKNLIKHVKEEKIKPSQHTQDCSAIKSRFDEIKKEVSIEILIEYSSKETKKKEHFEHNRGGFLMFECDTQSKLHRKSMEIE